MNISPGPSAARSHPARPERARPGRPARRGAVPESAPPGPAPAEPPRREAAPEPAPPDGGLPEWASERLAEFERHLAAERGLSPHTVRAYLGDVAALLGHACLGGLADLAALDIGVIRAWL